MRQFRTVAEQGEKRGGNLSPSGSGLREDACDRRCATLSAKEVQTRRRMLLIGLACSAGEAGASKVIRGGVR